MRDTVAIPRLVTKLAAHTHRSVATVSRLASGSGVTVRRLLAGADITSRRAERIVQWLSDHWPADLAWPADIPRPAPAAAPPAPLTRPARRQAVLDARRRMHDAVTASDWESAKAHERTMFEAALALRDDGAITDVEALCAALQVPRYVYDDVVRRYAHGRRNATRPPRRGSRVARMLQALRTAGDVRFTSRGGGAAAAAARTVQEAAR